MVLMKDDLSRQEWRWAFCVADVDRFAGNAWCTSEGEGPPAHFRGSESAAVAVSLALAIIPASACDARGSLEALAVRIGAAQVQNLARTSAYGARMLWKKPSRDAGPARQRWRGHWRKYGRCSSWQRRFLRLQFLPFEARLPASGHVFTSARMKTLKDLGRAGDLSDVNASKSFEAMGATSA